METKRYLISNNDGKIVPGTEKNVDIVDDVVDESIVANSANVEQAATSANVEQAPLPSGFTNYFLVPEEEYKENCEKPKDKSMEEESKDQVKNRETEK